MCGHGCHRRHCGPWRNLGRIQTGTHRLETPVGVIQATLHDSNRVSIENVPSYRYRNKFGRRSATRAGDRRCGLGRQLVFSDPRCSLRVEFENTRQLSDAARLVRQSLVRSGITGGGGQEIDHIEFFADSLSPDADSRKFCVLSRWGIRSITLWDGNQCKNWLAWLPMENLLPVTNGYRKVSWAAVLIAVCDCQT